MSRRFWAIVLTASLFTGATAHAHPMGNFAICHYTRLEAERDGLRLRYVLDLAEIPTFTEKRSLDRDGDGTVSDEEKTAYLAARTPELLAGLTLTINGSAMPLAQAAGDVQLTPGAGGLDTLRIVMDIHVPIAPTGAGYTVAFRDRNYESRTGWKEIVAVPGTGMSLRESSVPAADRSRELTSYPAEAVPPQDTTAHFRAMPGDGSAAPAVNAPAGPAADATPRDAFTQTIAHRDLSLSLCLAGLAIAFGFGALHALSPGHGKAMVAAYLAGARGTARHALLLGGVVTFTHTAGVFLLGLATLFTAQYVMPETLYPILGVVSGLSVCGVGVWLLYRRVRRLVRRYRNPTGAPATKAPGHHHDLPDGPVTVRTLIALGVSGGIIPCPSALVVLLSAVALHRIGYGLLLISAFSFGLAAVLVAIGLLVVYARQWLDHLPSGGSLLRRLPIASAALITLIGIGLIVRAVEQGMP
jgi:ABC-type nickel/cobalt efflux system permease component RcnA